MQAARMMQSQVQASDPREPEAIGVEPALIKYTITVMAAFEIDAKQ